MSDALINGVAGAGAGIVAQLITYPLQTVNTREQTGHEANKENNKLGTLQHMSMVVKHEGWGRLYGGLAPALVGTAASQGVYYYFYQIFRDRAEAIAYDRRKRGLGDGSVGVLSSLFVAALSGSVNVLLTIPFWVVVTRMQTHTKSSKKNNHEQLVRTPEEIVAAIDPPSYGTSRAVQEIYDEAGIWGFWKGLIPTLVMVSNPTIQFVIYETLLKKVKQRRAAKNLGSNGVTALEIFLIGAVAKLGATVATYPTMVVKSRLQAKQAGTDKRHHYKGTLDVVVKMIHHEGLMGFYKGMRTKIVHSVLAAAILFTIKEEIVKGTRALLGKNTLNKAAARKPL